MVWSEFTKKHLSIFKKLRYSLESDNKFLFNIRKEREQFKNFVKRNPNLEITILPIMSQSMDNIKNKMTQMAQVDWVDTKNVETEISQMPNGYQITWKTINDSVSPKLIGSNCDIPKTCVSCNMKKQVCTNINTITILVNNNMFKRLEKRIRTLIYLIEYLKHKTINYSKPVDIYIVLTSLEKTLPVNSTISISNVNTGYTNFDKNIIFVWRLEEFEKVTIHEVIHYYDMDNRHQHVDYIIDIEGPHSYYEAITDFWGIFYHTIYLSVITNISIKTLLEIELAFIKNQAMAINNVFNLGTWKDSESISIKQNTPAFSYYILKYLIYEYLLHNNFSEIYDSQKLLDNALSNGFKQTPYVTIKSTRMSLFQLK